jgi:murein DD-endopeptidase MepM/ murein hydrolase activator NlpD
MAKQDSKQKGRLKRLRHKFRLVVINDDTFKEEFSMLLSPMNLFTWGGLILIAFASLLLALVILTPIKELIPGYADPQTKRLASQAALKADSLDRKVDMYEQYIANLQAILKGEKPKDHTLHETSELNTDSIRYRTSMEDSMLRQEIENNEAYNISNPAGAELEGIILQRGYFFPPVNGIVSNSFDPGTKHYGVDVVPTSGEVVKSALDGMVIMSTWSSETGNVLQIQHSDNLITVYKHNSKLLKEVGDAVEAGEAVAFVGNSGELSSGPHLHFEIWHKGNPLNPEDYIAF